MSISVSTLAGAEASALSDRINPHSLCVIAESPQTVPR